jgi:serine/threonine-protein kinase RsbT
MEYRMTVRTETDATCAIMQARRSAAAAGFDGAHVSMLGTVASELVRNILKYAGSGELIVRILQEDGRTGLEMEAADRGPGIADIERALTDHVSTGGTLGLGLPAVRRMMDELRIVSAAGSGTTVTARKWRR